MALIIDAIFEVIVELTHCEYNITEPYDGTLYHTFICCKQLRLQYSGTAISGVQLGPIKENTRTCAMLQFAMKGVVLLQLHATPTDQALLNPLVTNQFKQTAFTVVLSVFKLAETFAEDEDDIATTSFAVNPMTGYTDYNQFIVGTRKVKLVDFIDSNKGLMSAIQNQTALCLLDFDVTVSLDSIFDDPNSKDNHYWFAIHPDTKLQQRVGPYRKHVCSQFVQKKVESHTAGATSSSATLEIKYSSDVITWLNNVDRLRDLLLAGLHINSGQPARGTELQTLQVRNRQIGAEVIKRNLIWMKPFNAFALLPSYNKSRTFRSASKVVRFVIGDLCKHLILYLMLIKEAKAFIEYIKHKDDDTETPQIMYEMKNSHSDYLFVGSHGLPLPAVDLRLNFAATFLEMFGVNLTFSGYRQLASMLTNAIQGLSSPFQLANRLRDTLNTGHRQAGHTIETAEHHYDKNTTNVAGIDRIDMIAFFNWTVTWLNFLSSGVRPTLDPAPINCTIGTSVPSTAVVAHHGAVTSSFNQPNITMTPRTTSPSIDVFTNDEQMTAVTLLKKVLPVSSSSSSTSTVYPTFRSESQKHMVLACIRATSTLQDLFFVMPTGFGKLLAVLTSAMYQREFQPSSQRLTVVIVPIIALIQDIKRRVEACGMSAHVYDGSRLLVDLLGTNVVIVTHERANSASFRTGLETLNSRNQLGTIICEEAHTFAAYSTFRFSMIPLARFILSLKTSVVMLTATAPPQVLNLLQQVVGISSFTITREICDRGNLRYLRHTVEGEGTSLQAVTVHICKLFIAQVTNLLMHGDCRVIIYCSLITEVNLLYDEILTACTSAIVLKFHGDLDQTQKRNAYDQWNETSEDGIFIFMIATTAFGMGIDADVQLVIHMGIPRSILDFIQGSGRAGRMLGSKGISLLLTSPANQDRVKDLVQREIDELDVLHRNPYHTFIRTNFDNMLQYSEEKGKCARQLISRFNGDSTIVSECIGISEPCDYCLRSYPSLESVRWTSNEGGLFRVIATWLNYWPALSASTTSLSMTDPVSGVGGLMQSVQLERHGESDSSRIQGRLADAESRKRNMNAVTCQKLESFRDVLRSSSSNCFFCILLKGFSHANKASCGWKNYITILARIAVYPRQIKVFFH